VPRTDGLATRSKRGIRIVANFGRFDEICAPRCLLIRDVFVSHRIGIDYIKFKGNFCVHLECSECFLFSVNELDADLDS